MTGAICTAGAAYTPGTVVSDIFSSRTPSPVSSPSLATSASSSPQRRISIEHPSGILEVGLAAAAQEAQAQLGIAFVERTVALIAHARVYYITPDRRPVRETPITSPSIVKETTNLFDLAYRPTRQAQALITDEQDILPVQLTNDNVDPCSTVSAGDVSMKALLHRTACV